jgi:prepilin-type N-terminal cleavage/methylation domain-containing protein
MSKYLKNNRGFTLIELLIVIGILAILATTVVMVINPAEMVKQSRDGNRMAELQSINKALLVYQSFGGSSSMGTSNIIYISLPDSDSQCGSYYGTLSATSTGWNYHCSPTADYRKTDGTGWIPVDLTSVESSSGSLFASLPIDPTNTATGQLYYTYIPGSWALSTIMESIKYLAANATSDGGQSSTRFEVGNNLSLNAVFAPWACGDNLSFTYREGSVTYGTVSHNSECWLDRNLGASQVATAFNDHLAYGDLFQWGRLDDGHQTIVWTSSSGSDGAEQSRETSTNSSGDIPGHANFILESVSPIDWRESQNNNLWQGASGINNPCPDGWRVPTGTELTTERLSWSSNDYIGAFASSLKFTTVGYRTFDVGAISWAGARGGYWSSSINTINASCLYITGGASLNSYSRAYGFAIRCIKD